MSSSHRSAPLLGVSRPSLALMAGVLAVPGSTFAWDLPAGGLYIGLPLALIAIALGRQARREGTGRSRGTAGAILGVLCIAQMAVWTIAATAGATPAASTHATGAQSDASYAASSAAVTNGFVTTQQTSCYRPEVPAMQFNFGPFDGYDGETPCPAGGATTGEDIGLQPYRTQTASNPRYPDVGPMLVKDHSESFLAADPAHPGHLIGSSKWEASPEGGILVLGFFESYDGGVTWPVQGHIPGYEGWTQMTDPAGAFDSYGNYYEIGLPYQYFFNADGSRNYTTNAKKEPNPGVPSEAVALVEHPFQPSAGRTATQWSATNGGNPQTAPLDLLRDDDSAGAGLDKPWIAIDTRPASPHRNRIYATWDEYHGLSAVTSMAAYADARPDGTHTPWSVPKALPTNGSFPNGTSLELPHVAANGWVYTTLTDLVQGAWKIGVDVSKDGGRTWSYAGTVADDIVPAPETLANTTTFEGVPYSFAVGNDPSGGGPLYVVWEDFGRGIRDLMLSTSTDAGRSWSAPIRVNDNAGVADAFQPTVTVQDTAAGTVGVTFYDRRLACPGTTAAADVPGTESYAAGLRLDTVNPNAPVPGQPPYGITNYCIDVSVQYYRPDLSLFADHPHNIRLTQHSWDPQLNAHRSSADPSQQTHFIGDYFGSVITGATNTFAFVSTFDDVTKGAAERNPANRQQQVVATLPVPTR